MGLLSIYASAECVSIRFIWRLVVHSAIKLCPNKRLRIRLMILVQKDGAGSWQAITYTNVDLPLIHDDVIKWNIFRVTGPLWGHRWIPPTKASDTGLRCFLWSAPAPWTDGSANNRDADNLRCHCVHNDVTVMKNRNCVRIQPQLLSAKYQPFCSVLNMLIYSGLATPYGIICICQHLLRYI